MDQVIHNFLTTGKLSTLELGLRIESVLQLLPSVEFTREMTDGLKVYEHGDLQLATVDDEVFQFTLYFQDAIQIFPSELNIDRSAIPKTKRHFLKYLNENDLVCSPYLNLNGMQIGVRLKSGVFVTFDRQRLHSIGRTRLHEELF